jgi:tetratricopeptide (TPR) repeat protein
MKILFSMGPTYQLEDPFIMEIWLKWFSQIDEQLSQSLPEYESWLLTFDDIELLQSDHFRNRRFLLSQEEIRNSWKIRGNLYSYLERGNIDSKTAHIILDLIKSKMDGYCPDVVFLLDEAPVLRKLFPTALFVNIELAWLHRAPYPMLWYLDTSRAGKGTVLSLYPDQILGRMRFDIDAQEFVARFKQIAFRLVGFDKKAIAFIQSLRQEPSQIILLPLAERCPCDGETPIFAELDRFLSSCSMGTIYILTMHPSTRALTENEIRYLTRKYKNVRYHSELNTQSLIPHVNGVIGDFSSVATQALLSNVPIISIYEKLVYADEYFKLRNPLARVSSLASRDVLDKILYWNLTHYLIPHHKLFNGQWVASFLLKAIELKEKQIPWQQFTSPLYSVNEWYADEWFQKNKERSKSKSVGGVSLMNNSTTSSPNDHRPSIQTTLSHKDLGVLYWQKGEKERALQHLEKAFSLDPGNPTLLKYLANFYYVELKDTDRAVSFYNKILLINPKDLETLLILGNIRVELGKFGEAKDCYLKVLEIAPSNGLASQMVEALEKRQHMGRENLDNAYQEAQSLIQSGDHDGAIDQLEKFLQVNPDYALAHNDLGFLYYEKGEKEKALNHYEKAVELDPKNITSLKNLADFYYVEAGRMEEALKIYYRILEAHPHDVETLLAFAHICTKLNRYTEAISFYKRVLEIEPTNETVRELM